MEHVKEKCTRCGEEFDPDFEGCPVGDADEYCDDCLDEYTFPCPWCCEFEFEEHRHAVGALLIVAAERAGAAPGQVGVEDGVYEITGPDYYHQPFLGDGFVHASAIKWLGPLPSDMRCVDLGGYPCGHLCRGCEPKMRLRAILSRVFTRPEGGECV